MQNLNTSCYYCGNPAPKILKATKAKKYNWRTFGIDHIIAALNKRGWSADFDVIQDQPYIACDICHKEYSIICINSTNCKCKEFVYTLLKITYLDRAAYPDIEKFMSENGIENLDLKEKLIVLTHTKTAKITQLHILFDKYYAALIEDNKEGYQIIEMFFTRKNLSGGNFLGE